jgi:hypothetical protein
LALERSERRKRLVDLEARMAAELATAPKTLEHAMLRASARPEEGTNAHHDSKVEQALLDEIAAAADKLGCPAEPPGKSI